MAFALQILFSFSLFMIFVCCYSLESHRNTFFGRVSVSLHQPVLLDCSGVYMPGRKWEFEDNILYAGQSFRGKVSGESFTLYNNYSLFISSMSFQYEGRYTCKQNESDVLSSYDLQVEVPPRLYMTIDDVRTSNETHQIDSNKPLCVACYADEARPSVNLTLLVNNKVLDSSNVLHEVSKSPDNNFTFDTVTLAQFRIKDEDGIISCEGSYSYAPSKFVVQANFVTYVLPNMKMSVLGFNETNNISVTANEEVVIICAANGARPSTYLTWIAEGIIETKEEERLTESLFNVSFHADTNTYNSYSEVRYLPYEGRQIVICMGENAYGIKQRYGLTLIGFGKHGDQPSRFEILLLVVAALTILVVLGVCLLIIRCKLFRGTQVSMNISEGEASKENTPNSKKTDPTLTDAVPREDKTDAVSREDKTDAVSLEDKTGAVSLEDKTGAVSLEDKTDAVSREDKTDAVSREDKTGAVSLEDMADAVSLKDKAVYYSEPKEKTTKDRIFQRNNICFILPLKMGLIYKRWKGTIDVPKKDQKCVVISTVTDSILHDNCINWSVFVERVLELPDTDYLVKVEGICVDTASVYLLHEHLVCETLESYLVFQETSCAAAEKLHFMKKCLLDIIKGMEHIQAFGFLHPGISIRKILVTQKGTCKLYDYCLAEDAPKKLVFMKSSRKLSVSMSIPPEALQRNEYTKESDVWSLASIVSTMTVNDLYFGYEDDFGGSEVYQRLRNNVLVDCLSTDPKLRLTVTQLRSCFEEVVQSSQEGRVPESSATDPVDVHVPMKTNITTKKETYI